MPSSTTNPSPRAAAMPAAWAVVRSQEGRRPPDGLVAAGQVVEQLGCRGTAAADVGVVRLDVGGRGRRAVGHDQHADGRVLSHRSPCAPGRRPAAGCRGRCRAGRPIPRLNTCPGRPPLASRTARTAAATVSQSPARHTAGSRLPCTAHLGAQPAPGPFQRHPPVDAHHVGPRLVHRLQQLAGADAEVDAGHAQVGQPAQHLAGGGQHVAAVVGRAEHARPRVEQLHRGRPRPHLGPQRGQHDVGQPVEQLRPTARARRA